MVSGAEYEQESSGRKHWSWFQETLARLPEIGTCFTHCRRDTSLSFIQIFSQIIYSKSTVFFTDYLQQIHNFEVLTSFVISFFLARLYEILYTPCIIQTADFSMKGGHYIKESGVLEQHSTASDACR